MKPLLVIAGIMVAVVAILNGYQAKLQLVSRHDATVANGTGADMIANLGCGGTYSDDKKAALFDRDYKNRITTVSGKVVRAGGARVDLAVLSSTLTYDIQVTINDPQSVYNLEKGQTITVRFFPTILGGCIMSFDGDSGVIIR